MITGNSVWVQTFESKVKNQRLEKVWRDHFRIISIDLVVACNLEDQWRYIVVSLPIFYQRSERFSKSSLPSQDALVLNFCVVPISSVQLAREMPVCNDGALLIVVFNREAYLVSFKLYFSAFIVPPVDWRLWFTMWNLRTLITNCGIHNDHRQTWTTKLKVCFSVTTGTSCCGSALEHIKCYFICGHNYPLKFY